MNIFDLLAEWNISNWLKKPKEKRAGSKSEQGVVEKGKTDFGKPYEGHLLDDIKGLIDEAHAVDNEERKNELLAEARKIETQLIMTYEKQGYNLLAASTQQLIREYESQSTSK